MKIHVLAVGKMRGPESDLCEEYLKRMVIPVTVKEIPTGTQATENDLLHKAIPPKAVKVVLDERGKDLSSREFAQIMGHWLESGIKEIVFIIGGADGLTDDIKRQADKTISLGRQTWPHKLVRVMLLEQLYRFQQINAGHPYHRD